MTGQTTTGGARTSRHTTRSARGRRIRGGVLAAVLVVGLAGLAGCGSDGDDGTGGSTASPAAASPTATSSTSSTPNTPNTPADPPTTVGGTRTTNSSSGGGAATAQVTVTAGRREGAAGHQYQVVVFTNAGSQDVRLRGYPSVAGLDSAGAVVDRAKHERGFPVTTVVLEPGEAASALVTAVSVPTGDQTSLPEYAALSVRPPGLRTATRLDVSLPAYGGLTVRPVVAGVTGE